MTRETSVKVSRRGVSRSATWGMKVTVGGDRSGFGAAKMSAFFGWVFVVVAYVLVHFTLVVENSMKV